MNIQKNRYNSLVRWGDIDPYLKRIWHDISFQITDPTSDGWVEVAPALRASCNLRAVVAFNGLIYAAGGGNANEGALLEWNGTDAWSEVADTYDDPVTGLEYSIVSLCVYNDKIYAGTSNNGYLLEWNGTDAWAKVADTLGGNTLIMSLCVYNDKLYGGTATGGRLFEWNGTDAWVQVAGALASQTYIYSLCVHDGALYGGTGQTARLFQWNDVDAWSAVASQYGSSTYIYGLVSWNGGIYGGTGLAISDGGLLLQWDEVSAWSKVADALDGQYIHTLLVVNNEIYAGTYYGGMLFKYNETNNEWIEICTTLDATTIYDICYLGGYIYGVTENGNLLRVGVVPTTNYRVPFIESDDAPSLDDGTFAIWHDTDDSTYNVIFGDSGTQIVGDFVKLDGSTALRGNWDAGSFKITAETVESDVATGTAPFVVASTTLVSNLNADLLDGEEGGHYENNVPDPLADQDLLLAGVGGWGLLTAQASSVLICDDSGDVAWSTQVGAGEEGVLFVASGGVPQWLIPSASGVLGSDGTGGIDWYYSGGAAVLGTSGLGVPEWLSGNDSVLVTGAAGEPELATTLPDGLTFGTLGADWDIGNGRKIEADAIWARDTDNLSLFGSSGYGILVTGKTVGINQTSPDTGYVLHITRDVGASPAKAFLAEGITTSTSGKLSSFVLKTTSTGNMADGFGGGFIFAIEDNAATENYIAIIYGYRDGADNSGKISFEPYNAGTRLSQAVTIDHTGLLYAKYGITIHEGNDLSFETTTGSCIGSSASEKFAFWGATPIVQLAKASYNNWASLSDVVSALVDVGLFDQV